MHTSRRVYRKGFALPTVLIASVVLLTVLAVSVSATSAIRTTLKAQYYTQLAQAAGDAGVAYAKACLAANGNVPQWSDAKPLTPATNCSGDPIATSASVAVLVVAGGGSGGGSSSGNGGPGGGGAGGLIYNSNYSVAKDDVVTVTVGAGATPVVMASGTGHNGENSVFGSLTAIGGGGGGRADASSGNGGLVGGSGGGAGYKGYTTVTGAAGTAGQGNAGGSNLRNNNGAGGGGAGGAGGDTTNTAGSAGPTAGLGGPGLTYAISGSPVTYAKGGDGSCSPSYCPTYTVVDGAANTGNGGSGGLYSTTSTSGAGGSGIVIVSYPTGTITATGGTITTSGGNTIHTFTSSGTFTVTSVNDTPSCPTDPRCSVTVNGNIRSAFTIGLPTLDSNGKAVAIPVNGYVNILRSSNGAVWKTYTQPATQAAVVPSLCSSLTDESAYGWVNASLVSSGVSFPVAAASSIGLSGGSASSPGPIYFRKDFSVTSAGSYTVQARADNSAKVYIDGNLVVSPSGYDTTSSATVSLSAGCHSIDVRVLNSGIAASNANLSFSLKKTGLSKPIVVSDTSWRVNKGNSYHFSQSRYYADPTNWTAVRDYSAPGWADDTLARGISTTHGYSGSNYSAGYAYFRDDQPVVVTSAVDVRVGAACITSCVIYMDGEVLFNASSTYVSYANITLQPGVHQFAVKLYHSSASGISYFYFGVLRTSDNAILTDSDPSWLAADSWTATDENYYSYDTTYSPVPYPVRTAYVQALVVAGGGGGGGQKNTGGGPGGGGAGGLIYNSLVPLTVGSQSVTVGAGGAGGLNNAAGPTNGSNGSNSIFASLTAIGGGGGHRQDGLDGEAGGSGGGGSGGSSPAAGNGGAGTFGQGYGGAAGRSTSPFGGGGGGGARDSGQGGSVGKAGGIGMLFSIGGSWTYYAGGGGGGAYTTETPGAGGLGGGGAGANQSTNSNTGNGNPGTANTGGGGGGANGSPRGGTGGAGGSGIVIIAYPTGLITASGGTVTTAGGYTIHTFTSSGTFTVSAINV